MRKTWPAVLLLAACSSVENKDGGVGTLPDAVVEDAGANRLDAATVADAAEVDAAPDAGVADGAAIDTSFLDSSVHDAGFVPADASCGASGVEGALIEDFTSTMNVDIARSTAQIDPAGAGFVRAHQARAFGSIGNGGEGAFRLSAPDAGSPATDGGLASGTHAFSGFTLDGVQDLVVPGDLEIETTGDFVMRGGATLYVRGNLTVIAGRTATICGSIYAAGNVRIEQPGTQGVTLGCPGAFGYIYSGYADAQHGLVPTSPGDIEVRTRGGVTVDGFGIYSGRFGSGAAARSGNFIIRSYGDLLFGHAASSYAYVGDVCTGPADPDCAGANGEVQFYSEGRIVLDQNSYLYGGTWATNRQQRGGAIRLRAASNVELRSSSYAYATGDAPIEILSEGDVLFAGGSYAYAGQYAGVGATPGNVIVRGRSISLTGDSYLYAAVGGSVDFAATGPILLDGSSYVYGGDGACRAAGGVSFSTEDKILVTNQSYANAGNSASGPGCAAQSGGRIDFLARAAIVADPLSNGVPSLTAGAGSPPGTVSMTMNATVCVALDALLEPPVSAVSSPIALTATRTLTGVELGATIPPSYFGVHVFLQTSPARSSETAAHCASCQPLGSGWRYDVELEPRMFDDSALDGFAVFYQ